MTNQDFQQRVYYYLIKYKEDGLKIIYKGISSRGIAKECLFSKSYCDVKIPADGKRAGFIQ